MSHKTGCSLCTIKKNSIIPEGYAQASVVWIGLSAKYSKNQPIHKPLSAETNSGSIINEIELRIRRPFFHRTNLVKCAPLTAENKMRYPTQNEIKCCFPNLSRELEEIKPKVVFLLGKSVADYVVKRLHLGSYTLSSEYQYTQFELDHTYFIPIHHPSFIRIYRYKTLGNYQDCLIEKIQSLAS